MSSVEVSRARRVATKHAPSLGHAVIAGCLAVLLGGATGLLAQENSLGETVYTKYCAHCHGAEGDGKGVAAPYLKPVPRDFTSGKYKIRTTPTGFLPTDDNLKMVLERGLPYTSMPAFPNLSPAELDAVIQYIKAFSSDFEDREAHADPFPIPTPPPYTPESVEKGREVYAQTGCARCHGDLGRGNGNSAPTLVDDWGRHIRVADLTMPWTFRGGGSRQDIFRTMSAGFNGTPMPGFHGSLPVEDIWSITNYMVSLSGGPSDKGTVEAPYGQLLRAVGTEDEIDLERGAELFANAPKTMFPIVGQIVEPGRNFYPSAVAVTAQAVYNTDEIAIRLTWNDMRAERSGQNGPDIAVPRWDEDPANSQGKAASGESEGDFWGAGGDEGGSEDGDFWGTEDGGDDAAADSGDFWGSEDEGEDDGGGDFWGDDDGGAAPAESGPASEFSDAVAIQFPVKMPEGVVKPYVLFGDAQNPVELWFADLAQSAASTYVGRGSAAVTPGEDEPPAMVTAYDQGEWSVIFKRKRKSRTAISFEENTFIPVAFSVWDGFNRERGNKRGLTAWYDLYLEPLATPSPIGPMTRAGLGVLGLELLIIALVRRRYGKGKK